MSTTKKHISKLLDQVHKIQKDGHIEKCADGFVALNDLELSIFKLQTVFNQVDYMKGKQTNEH